MGYRESQDSRWFSYCEAGFRVGRAGGGSSLVAAMTSVRAFPVGSPCRVSSSVSRFRAASTAAERVAACSYTFARGRFVASAMDTGDRVVVRSHLRRDRVQCEAQ
ncbi:hypothetical protein GCM10009551_044960 [Nocardiopsis tropica]